MPETPAAEEPRVTAPEVSLGTLLSRFRLKIVITVALVVLEAVADVLFPLFIGIAINGLLDDTLSGVVALGGLTAVALVLGSARRLYDTRAYAAIYEIIGVEMVERERARGASVSVVVARSTLLGEFVQFLEGSLPAIVTTAISLVGVLVIVGTISIEVCLACLALFVLVIVQYWATEGFNHRLNAGYNDELEAQVEALSTPTLDEPRAHFKKLMRWSIRLSDLETLNYFVIFIGVIALLVYSPIVLVEDATTQYGFVFSALIYVFQYIEALMGLPYFFQQIIRLREISQRLAA